MRDSPDVSRTTRRKVRSAWIALAGLAVFAFGVHGLVYLFNAIKIAGFPLGFYMAAQGSLVAFAILLFLFVRRQDKIGGEGGAVQDYRPVRNRW